jgi:hypothetical protein
MHPTPLLAAAMFGLLAAHLCPSLDAQSDPDRTVGGGGTLPAGWRAQTDRGRPLGEAKIVALGTGLQVTLGPAVILWRDQDVATGAYHVVARFSQTRAPRHPEGYGLFIGGSHLADARNRYTYFLVRGDGTFLVKRRIAADSTAAVSAGWTASKAVVKADSAGQATNELSVAVEGAMVRFRVNGTDVFHAPAAELDVRGLVGYRVNHNLDVQIGTLEVHGQ